MVFNTQCFQIVPEITECVEGVNERKSEGEDEAEQCGDDERHYLIVGEAGGKKSDANEGGPEEQQSEIGAPGAAHIQVSDGIAYPIDRYHIYERGQEGDGQQGEAGEELCPHDLHVGERKGEQEVHGARAFLLREGAHHDGRDQEEEQELRQVEKSLQICQS